MKSAIVSVVFDIKKIASKTKQGLVQIRVTYNRDRKYFSTGIKLYSDQWSEKNMVKGRTDATQLNERIRVTVNKIQDYVTIVEKSDDVLDFKKLEEYLKVEESGSFLDYMKKRIEERPVKESTKRRARSVFGSLKEFGKIKSFADLTPGNIKLWDEYAWKKCNEQSAVYNYHKNLKIFVRDAYVFDHIQKNPYEGIKLKKGEKDIRKYLTPEELERLESCEIVEEHVSQTRDVFVFCCYTGLAYVDLAKFNWNDVEISNGKYRIRDERQKSDTTFNITIMSKAYKILEKYNFDLPVMSSQNYNIYLKSVGAIAKIRKELTSHVARHTFATTVTLANGVRLEAVSKMLGHKHLRTTEIYAKVLQSEVDKAFDKLDETLKTDEVAPLKMRFVYHSVMKYCNFSWNIESGPCYDAYNEKLNRIKNALEYINYTWIGEYLIEEGKDEFNHWSIFEVPTWGIDKIIEYGELKRTVKMQNIKYGQVYFRREIDISGDRLSNIICNKGGVFTLEHQINEKLFNQIQEYSLEFNDEYMKENNVLDFTPGLVYSIEAVKELAKTNRVYVDNELFKL